MIIFPATCKSIYSCEDAASVSEKMAHIDILGKVDALELHSVCEPLICEEIINVQQFFVALLGSG